MSLQPLGLGFNFSATDLASGVMARVGMNFSALNAKTDQEASKWSDSVKKVGAGLGLIGGIGVAAFHATVAAAGEFEKRITEITTLTEEASLGFDSVYDSVLDMNAAFGGGTGKQAKAFYDGVSAGASNAAEANALMQASNKLAVAGVTEVNVALDGLTSSLNAYGDNFANATQYSDAMFVAVRKGKTTVEQLSSVIGRVAPTALAMGVSFDEVAASMSAITTKGLKTEEAATGLKAALANIIKPASDATAEAARLGIKFDAATVRSKGFAGLLATITGSAKFNKDSLAKLFGSVEALNAVLALTANGSKNFKETLEAMGQKSGATEGAFEKMSNTLAFQEKRFAGLVENAKIVIGDALVPLAKHATNFTERLVKGFMAIPLPIRNVLVQGLALAATMAVVVGGALALTGAILPVVAALGLGALGFATFRAAAEDNVGGFGAWARGMIDDLKLGFTALGELFSTGGFSEKTFMALEKNPGLENFVIKVFLWGNRARNFWNGLVDGFHEGVRRLEPVFADLGRSAKQLFGPLGEGIDNQGAGAAFEKMGEKGRRAGVLISEVAGRMVKALTMALDLANGIGKVVAAFGGLDNVLQMAKLALVAYVAFSVASGTPAMFAFGNAVLKAGTALATMSSYDLTRSALVNAGSVLTALKGAFMGAETAVWSLRGALASLSFMKIVSAIAAATGPLVAFTLMVAALYAAYQQFVDAKKAFDASRDQSGQGHGWSDIGKKIRRDVGELTGGRLGTTQEEYEREIGIKSGADHDAYQQQLAWENRDGMRRTQFVSPSTEPVSTQSSSAGLDALADAIKATPPKVVGGRVELDGREIGRLLLEQIDGDKNRGGGQMPPGG